MKPIRANTPRSKIRVLKLVKKFILENKDPLNKGEMMKPGFCAVLHNLYHYQKLLADEYSPEDVGLKRPRNSIDMFWYSKYKIAPRIANINRTIKRLEKEK